MEISKTVQEKQNTSVEEKKIKINRFHSNEK